jgi:hypothetical protein
VTDEIDATAVGSEAGGPTGEPSLQSMIGNTVSSAPAGQLISSARVSLLEDGEGLRSQSNSPFSGRAGLPAGESAYRR